MIGVACSTTTPSAYVCNIPVGEVQSQFSSAVASVGSGSTSASDSKCLYIDMSSYMPLLNQLSSSNAIRVNDMLASQRRHLYDMLSLSPLDDDSQALAFFEEMRSAYDDVQCFGQITKIFLGAYKKKDESMVVRTLRFMQNFNYDEIGQAGASAARMALLDSKNLDVQSAALSLVLRWKTKEFKSVLAEYNAPNDPFISLKMKKIIAWYTSEK